MATKPSSVLRNEQAASFGDLQNHQNDNDKNKNLHNSKNENMNRFDSDSDCDVGDIGVEHDVITAFGTLWKKIGSQLNYPTGQVVAIGASAHLLSISNTYSDYTAALYLLGRSIAGDESCDSVFTLALETICGDVLVPTAGQFSAWKLIDAFLRGRIDQTWPGWLKACVNVMRRVGVVAFAWRMVGQFSPEGLRDFIVVDNHDVAMMLIDGARDLVSRIARATSERRFIALFDSDDNETYTLLLRLQELVVASDDAIGGAPSGPDYFPSKIKILEDLHVRIDNLIAMKRVEFNSISFLRASLVERISGMRKRMASEMARVPPLSILLYSMPGAMKSFIFELIHHAVGTAWGLDISKTSVYPVYPGQKYYDDQDPVRNWAVTIDELASVDPDHSDVGESVRQVLDWVNVHAKPLPAANLNEKFKHFANARLVVGMTNVKGLDANKFAACQGMAVLRRFPFTVTVLPKSEFCFAGSVDIDPTKINADSDAWDFVIQRPKLANNRVVYEDLAHIGRTADFYRFFFDVAKQHIVTIGSVDDAFKGIIARSCADVISEQRINAMEVVCTSLAVHRAQRMTRRFLDDRVSIAGLDNSGFVLLFVRCAAFLAFRELALYYEIGPYVFGLICFGVGMHVFGTIMKYLTGVDVITVTSYSPKYRVVSSLFLVILLVYGVLNGFISQALAGFLSGFGVAAILTALTTWALNLDPQSVIMRVVETNLTDPLDKVAMLLVAAKFHERVLVLWWIPRWLKIRSHLFFQRYAVLIETLKFDAKVAASVTILAMLAALFVALRLFAYRRTAKTTVKTMDVIARDRANWEQECVAQNNDEARATGQIWTNGSVRELFTEPARIPRGAYTRVSRDMTFGDMYSKVRANTVSIMVKRTSTDIWEHAQGLFVVGNYVAFCAHAIPRDVDTFEYSLNLGVGASGTVTSLVRIARRYYNCDWNFDHDLAVVRVESSPRGSLVDAFPSRSLVECSVRGGLQVKMCVPDDVGRALCDVDTVLTEPLGVITTSTDRGVFNNLGIHIGWESHLRASGSFGVLGVDNRTRVVVGPVTGVRTGFMSKRGSVVQVTTREELLALIESCERNSTKLTSLPVRHCEWIEQIEPLGDKPSARSWAGIVDSTKLMPFVYRGSLNAIVKPKMRTRVTPWRVRFQPWLEECGKDFAAPQARPMLKEVGGEFVWVDPMARAFETGRAGFEFDPCVRQWAIDDFVGGLSTTRKIRPLTIEEAFIGCDELGVPPMDLSKSAGYGWPGNKLSYVEREFDEHGKTVGCKVAPALRVAISKKLDGFCGRSEKEGYAAFTATYTFKEEIVGDTKAESGDTRVFNVLPVHDSGACRMVLAPVLAAFNVLPISERESAIGLNAASYRDCLKIYLQIQRLGKNVFDGDLSKYDKRQKCSHMSDAGRVLQMFALRCGYNDVWAGVVGMIVTSYCFADCVAQGVVVSQEGSMPSGGIGTTEVNGIVECLLWRCEYAQMVFERTGRLPDHPFREVVSMLTLGDDNETNVVPDLIVDFNRVELARRLLLHGHELTGSSKDRRVVDTRDIESTTFLKRSFVYRDGLWYMPLAMSSILKAVCYAVSRDTLPDGQRDALAIANAARECYLHGAAVYERFVTIVRGGPGECPVGYKCNPNIETYETLHNLYLEDSFTTFDSGLFLARGGVPHFSAEVLCTSLQGQGISSPQQVTDGVNVSSAVAGVPLLDAGLSKFARGDGITETIVTHEKPRVGVKVNDAVTLKEYFSRPILVSTLTIASGNTAIATIKPLTLWASSSTIIRKLINYRYMKGTLKYLVQLAATPMHYGLIKIGFLNDNANTFRGNAGVANTSQLFQLPGVLLDVCDSPSVELRCPISTPTGWIDLESNSGIDSLSYSGPALVYGTIKPLSHSTLATAPSVTLTIRVSCDDIELVVPTSSCSVALTSLAQSHEQTTEGLVSKPATFISNTLALLAPVPVIGPLATAASIIAKGIAGVASFFGYSRPVERGRIEQMTVNPNRDMSAYDGVDWVAPGSLDPASEVSVDPVPNGLSSRDHMSFAHIWSCEGLVFGSDSTLEWAGSTAAGTVLGSIPVIPMVFDKGAGGGAPCVLPPVGFTGPLFSQWSGSLEYTIRVVANPFFRGKLRVVYYPSNNIEGSHPLDMTARYSVVIDIASRRNVCVRVGWQSSYTSLMLPNSFSSVPTTSYSENTGFGYPYYNGRLDLVVEAVLNGQLAAASALVGIVVSVKGGPTHSQEIPSRNFLQTAVCTSMSGAIPGAGGAAQDECIDLVPSIVDPRVASACTKGERFTHLRPLLHAYVPLFAFDRIKAYGDDTASLGCAVIFPRRWFDSGLLYAGKNFTGGVAAIPLPNTLYVTPITYLRTGFGGERGSLRYRFHRIGPYYQNIALASTGALDGNTSLSIARGTGTCITLGQTAPSTPYGRFNYSGHGSSSCYTPQYAGELATGRADQTGLTLYDERFGHAMGINAPYRAPFLYVGTSTNFLDDPTYGSSLDDVVVWSTCFDDLQAAGVGTASSYHYTQVFMGAGDDFTLFDFICCPIMATTSIFPL